MEKKEPPENKENIAKLNYSLKTLIGELEEQWDLEGENFESRQMLLSLRDELQSLEKDLSGLID